MYSLLLRNNVTALALSCYRTLIPDSYADGTSFSDIDMFSQRPAQCHQPYSLGFSTRTPRNEDIYLETETGKQTKNDDRMIACGKRATMFSLQLEFAGCHWVVLSVPSLYQGVPEIALPGR